MKNKHLLEVGCGGIMKLGWRRRRRRWREVRKEGKAGSSPLSPVVIFNKNLQVIYQACQMWSSEKSGIESEETFNCTIFSHDALSTNCAL